MSNTLPLAPQGVFRTIQGEGSLLGLPMVFIRLAGCSIGCPGCDTDYSVSSRCTVDEIVRRVSLAGGTVCDWVWITGGEPTDHDLNPLIAALHGANWRVALATAGTRPVQRGSLRNGVDFLSVSPHGVSKFMQRRGSQINLVPGLNGLRLEDFESLLPEIMDGFEDKWVTPCDGSTETLAECIAWVNKHPGWRLGVQAHKTWSLP